MQTGVVDIGFSTGAFYTNVMPEADILKLYGDQPIAEQRKNGGYDLINKIWNEKANMQYLGRVVEFTPFHLYLNKKIDKPDLTGLKIRITPVYRDFFQAMNATVMHHAARRGVHRARARRGRRLRLADQRHLRPELAREDQVPRRPGLLQRRGVAGDEPAGLQGAHARAARVPGQAGARRSRPNNDVLDQVRPDETERQQKAGIQVISFDAADQQGYRDKAYEVAWEAVVKASPESRAPEAAGTSSAGARTARPRLRQAAGGAGLLACALLFLLMLG